MGQIFNQYSAVWIAAALTLAAAVFVFRHKPRWQELVGLDAAVLDLIHARGFSLLSRADGFDRGGRPSAWFLFQKSVEWSEILSCSTLFA
ncbi:MAG: hypothetical protein H3C52_01250 [Anaerolineales bacterium]|nr:hypothetical protein [Anaerolineales bacterium]